MLIDNRFRQDELYLSTAHNIELLPHWELNVSADYQYNALDANLVNFVHPSRHTLLVAFATQYQWRRFRAMASLLGTNVWDRTTVAQSRVRDALSRWTPAVYISYNPIRDNRDLSLRFFYKKIFRLPTFNDLYYTEVGNTSLKPENTQQLDLGLIYQHDWMRGVFRHVEFKADGYYNRVDNKIIAVPRGSGQYRWMMMNVGKVRILGVETTAQTVMRWCRDWSLVLCANYTYQSAQDRTDPSDNDPYYGTYGGQIAYIPWHSGSATGNLRWKGLSLNYAFVYVGERYHASSNIRENYEQPWYTHDLSLGYTLDRGVCPGIGKWFRSMTFTLECNNVFDQQYDVVPNYPMPGRNWRGCIRVEL
jgi:outer membrane cobalamin receptor